MCGMCPFNPSKIKVNILGLSEHFQAPSSSLETTSPSTSRAGATPTSTSTPGATPTSTSTAVATTPTSSGSSRPCTPSNPLLEAGLIPESQADLLQVPQRTDQPIRRRIIAKARVITGDEYTDVVRKKDEEERQEEEKQRRKAERQHKKAKRRKNTWRNWEGKNCKRAKKEQRQSSTPYRMLCWMDFMP